MVAVIIELCQLIAQGQIVIFLLPRQLISEAQAVVKQSEAQREFPFGLVGFQVHCQLPKVILNFRIFSPYGVPRALHTQGICLHHAEAHVKQGLVGYKAQSAWLYQLFTFVIKRIKRPPLFIHKHVKR